MSIRAISNLVITFGLVSLPVKVFSATNSENKIEFRQVNPETGNRVKQQLVDGGTGEVVARSALVKGYEIGKEQFVTFTTEETKAVEAEASKAIVVAQFVPSGSIDPTLVEKPYFIGPDKAGERAYELLRRALVKEDKVGIGQYAMRGKQYLVALRGTEDGILMYQLRYQHEVRTWEEVPVGPRPAVQDVEVDLACQIIRMTSADEIDHTKFKDTVYEGLRAMVDAKVDGKTFVVPESNAPAPAMDLMAALKASLGG